MTETLIDKKNKLCRALAGIGQRYSNAEETEVEPTRSKKSSGEFTTGTGSGITRKKMVQRMHVFAKGMRRNIARPEAR